MAQVTGGKYSYTRVIKDDDFGPKREFTAELSFNVGEDDPANDIGEVISQQVVEITHKRLNIRSGSAAAGVQARPGSPSPASPPPAADPVPSKAPVNDKERLAAEAGLTVAAPAPVKAKKAPKIEAKPAEVEDDLSELFGESEPAKPARVITDKEIIDAVNKKNGVLKDPPRLVALKEKYVGKLPKQLRDIPAERREEFLKELDELK